MTKKEQELIQRLIKDAEKNKSFFNSSDSGQLHAISYIAGRLHAYNEIITLLEEKQ